MRKKSRNKIEESVTGLGPDWKCEGTNIKNEVAFMSQDALNRKRKMSVGMRVKQITGPGQKYQIK